jgi:CheY-like chemotaxis protein
VLVVEDESLVGLMLEEMLCELGASVVGVATDNSQALQFIEAGDIDAGILDLNLGGVRSYPTADALRARGVPYVFATGYGSLALEGMYASDRVVQKPYSIGDISAALHEIAR